MPACGLPGPRKTCEALPQCRRENVHASLVQARMVVQSPGYPPEGGSLLSMKMKMAFSGLSLMRLRMT